MLSPPRSFGLVADESLVYLETGLMSRLSFRPVSRWLTVALAVCSLLVLIGPVQAQTIARCGQGWLEKIDGYHVLHLKGTPYEMGYQHGALLKQDVKQSLQTLLVDKAQKATLVEVGPVKVTPRAAIEMIVAFQEPHIAPRYVEEIKGLADGAGISVSDARAANFIPELFHCSGFSLAKSATKNGNLLHGRVLDYATDWGLQDHAVIVVYEPEGRLPWVNVGYAGFLGTVTGMNAAHVSIGEMGGGGLGHWNGRPMTLIMREALETAQSLDEAISVFRDGPRTCEYYYVIADGETNEAVGMEASWDKFAVVPAGEAHPRLPKPVKDCVLLSAGSRYDELVKRAAAGFGKFTAEEALHLMDRPVAMSSNLHNVLFEPATTKLWVANASTDRKPAADQKYFSFQLSELLKRRPTSGSPELPLPTKTVQLAK